MHLSLSVGKFPFSPTFTRLSGVWSSNTVTTFIGTHFDQTLGRRLVDQSLMPMIGQMMEEIAQSWAAGGEVMDPTRVTRPEAA